MGDDPWPEDELTTVARGRVGRVLLEKWRLDQLLGVGGMAAVYAATHRNGNRVAIKLLHPQLSLDPSVRDRFLREGYVANAVEHEGAVKVLDDDVDEDGSVVLVMELLLGETLDSLWERSGARLPAQDVIAITDQILDVLAVAHERGIVHRDVKPENVFVTRDGRVKILDFGIARLLERAGGASATRTGSMLGTPAFMPPEQALGHVQDVDHRSDLWAVGASMFALLSGELVHDGQTPNEQLIAAATKDARSLGAAAPELPVSLIAVVDRALAFRKEQRWPDARAMQRALRKIAWAPPDRPPAARTGTVVQQLTAPSSIAAATATSSERRALATGTVVAPPRTVGQTMPWNKPVVTSTAAAMATGHTLSQTTARGQNAWVTAGVAGGLAVVASGLVLAGVLLARQRGAVDHAVESAASINPPVLTTTAEPPLVGESLPIASASVTPGDGERSLPTASATLTITAASGACVIALDGKNVGKTPLHELSIDPGSHTVTCTAAGRTAIHQVVKLDRGQSTSVSFVIPRATGTAVKRSIDPLDVR